MECIKKRVKNPLQASLFWAENPSPGEEYSLFGADNPILGEEYNLLGAENPILDEEYLFGTKILICFEK